jgi:hypothetical protein
MASEILSKVRMCINKQLLRITVVPNTTGYFLAHGSL